MFNGKRETKGKQSGAYTIGPAVLDVAIVVDSVDVAGAVGRAVQRAVVKQDGHLVGSDAQVKLKAVGTLTLGLAECLLKGGKSQSPHGLAATSARRKKSYGKRVLGVVGGGTAVGDALELLLGGHS